jgi:dTDP-4-amino-4,6-dideoxygalactose transaminase
MVANHGQVKKYVHKYIGVNSRLDTIQAAILDIKLKYLDSYNYARQLAADRYDQLLSNIFELQTPVRASFSTHVFHQYSVLVKNKSRDKLKSHLESLGIPAMIYYPIPLNEQEAYRGIGKVGGSLQETEFLCSSVLSLPMHTELTLDHQQFIADAIKSFYN